MSAVTTHAPREKSAPAAPIRRPNIIVMHGEKGGVGKSFAASLAGSAALKKGMALHVIETDSSVPDVAPRFAAVAGVSALALDRGQEASETLVALLGHVEGLLGSASPPDSVIINSPAGASGVLDGFGDVFSSVAEQLNADLTVGFLVDDSPAVLPKIEESLETGLLSLKSARRAVIYAGWRGPADRFPFTASSARAAALANGVAEHVFPPLQPAALLDQVRRTNAPFFSLLEPPAGLKIVDRSLLARWLAAAAPLADWLINV